MLTQTIEPSATPTEACNRFLHDIRTWVHDCVARYADAPPTDVHDQGTYTTGWEPYIRLTGDTDALAFLKRQRDRIHAHFVTSGQWRHGYWRMQEAHHGTEHFELFLGMLLRLDPDDAVTIAQMVDAAEHMGNWAADVPAWFDWESGLFRSLFFGTDGVRREPDMELNSPDHLRCINICLLAHRATGEQCYLDLAQTHVGRWAQAILDQETLPLGLHPAGPLYALTDETEALYRSFVGQASALAAPVDRAENFLTSDAINTFLYLWQQSGDGLFRRAAERLLDVLAMQLADPDAGAAADAIRHYRRATGDARYDGHVRSAITACDPYAIQSIGLDPTVRSEQRPSGIGKRSDMPLWLEDGAPRRHNPITLALGAEILNDAPLATCAIDLARTYFALARRAFPDGRDHGCAARSISAVVRGHGRDNHAGLTTAVLGPLAQTFAADTAIA